MENQKTIYQKLAEARASFHTTPLKKSGHNKFAGYKYFELGDFVQPGMDCLRNAGLVAFVSFGTDVATMTVREFEGNGEIVITSPMSSAALKGCHEVQNLGAVETYLRRYLWCALMEVIENDIVDASNPDDTKKLSDKSNYDMFIEKCVEAGYGEKDAKLALFDWKINTNEAKIGSALEQWDSKTAKMLREKFGI